MKGNDFVEIVIYFFLLTAGGLAGGLYMARVLAPDAQSVLAKIESIVLRLLRMQKKGMDAREYLIAVLWFSLFSFLSVFLLMLAQNHLPLFPEKARLNASSEPVIVGLAFNTAMSFMTNTNWQAYSGESTLSYFVQMTGLTVQNFASAAVGMAVMLVMFRGFTRSETKDIGNFYADLFRITFYVLLPASILVAIFLSSQGVVQSFGAYAKAHTLEGAEQIVPLGPAASQIAIKQIGTNGGGFFGVNSAHPLENPTPLSNFVEVYSILWLAAACWASVSPSASSSSTTCCSRWARPTATMGACCPCWPCGCPTSACSPWPRRSPGWCSKSAASSLLRGRENASPPS
jgi:K+-transporting ATPase ATPase A chain